MATRGVQFVAYYGAWNTANNDWETGDAANHSLQWVKDGTDTATTNSGSEIDAANSPGQYKVTITATEADCLSGQVNGKSSTSDVIIIPTSYAFEYIPNAAPGAAGGLFIAGSNAATTANITGNITGNLSGSVGSVTGAVGSVTGNVGGNVAGSVGSVTGNVGGNVSGSVGSIAAGGIDAASFAAGAITATAIDTGAIDAAALATDAVDEIRDGVWAKTLAELTGDPGATPAVSAALMLLYMALRNLRETTASDDVISDDSGSAILTAALSDDTTTFSKGKYA